MSLKRHQLAVLLPYVLTLALARPASAQTYKVDSGNAAAPKQDSEQTSQPKSLGWGSNIENARLARSAEQALEAGNYAQATDYAQRACRSAPDDPQLWFLLGYAARLARRSDLSIESYKHGLRLAPSSLDGQSGLAQTYASLGRTAEAEPILRNVLAADPKRATDAQLLGEILLRSGKYDDALEILGHAEDTKPDARTEVLIALCYEHLQKLDQAHHYLDLAKHRAPNNPEVERSLAGYYRDTGDYPSAITELKSIANPRPDVKAELAYTYQLNGQPEESAKLYVEAANAVPGDLTLQLSAAQAEVGAGSPEAADPFLQRAATIDADNYRLHALRGEIARLQDRNEDAVKEYEAALAHMPTDQTEGALYPIQMQMNLVEAYKDLQDQTSADQHLAIAQKEIAGLDVQGSGRAEFLRLRAMIKINAGDLPGAEQDAKEALALNPKDPNNLQLGGDLLVKLGRTDEAIATYQKILDIDPKNRLALTALGFASRTAGRDQDAEKYFLQLAKAYPKLYVPHLALGDLYASRHEFDKAETSYSKAYSLSTKNSAIIAGGMNAAIEAKHYPIAKQWLDRATPAMLQDAHVMREQERYLSFTGDYQRSAEVGREAIKKLPDDRDVVVYLGYDLLHLEQYDELAALTAQYENVPPSSSLSKEPDIPLLAGYVHKHSRELEQAEKDFTLAIARGPNAATAYVNRGYVRHDLRKSNEAESDFETALRIEPANGEAHLGLAYASLDLHQPRVALRQVQMAQDEMGQSLPIHLIRATAYADMGSLHKAAAEYHAAITYAPTDGGLHLALADVLYGLGQYRESVAELQTAETLSPNNSLVYAKLARSYAQLRERDQTLQNVELAERQAETDQKDVSGVYVATGEALGLLGDHKGAMDRFSKALDAPNTDPLAVRLKIAQLMAGEGQWDDARRQIALGVMDAETQSEPPTGNEYMEAAGVFLTIHDFPLAQDYYQRALAAGASDTAVRVGLANTYLAQGDTTRAQAQLSAISSAPDDQPTYQLLLAQANVFQQLHNNVQALTSFAQAANAAGDDETAERELMQTAGAEGMRINRRISFLSDFSVEPIFEDTTVYPLDAKLDVTNPIPGRQNLLPTPRSSIETQWTGAYHLHYAGLPGAAGFFQVRNARGEISLPSADTIVDRDTTDYSFNFGLNPTLRLGTNALTFSAGIQETIRRDALDPFDMNQNLFRQFLYMNTSAFLNAVAVSGYAIRESGPFTESGLRSRALSGALDFRIGRPWSKTALVTGWGARDEQFAPVTREFYQTSTYLGFERKVNQHFSFRAIAEDLRTWRVQQEQYAIAQAIRPAGSVVFSPTRNWSVQGSVAYSRNMSFHEYDAVQSGFAVSYSVPVRQVYKGEGQEVDIHYPIRFSGGMQEESFYNFTGGSNEQFRPYFSITIF